jgi:hypothetical protein
LRTTSGLGIPRHLNIRTSEYATREQRLQRLSSGRSWTRYRTTPRLPLFWPDDALLGSCPHRSFARRISRLPMNRDQRRSGDLSWINSSRLLVTLKVTKHGLWAFPTGQGRPQCTQMSATQSKEGTENSISPEFNGDSTSRRREGSLPQAVSSKAGRCSGSEARVPRRVGFDMQPASGVFTAFYGASQSSA